MRARDIMSRTVISVTPETLVLEAAALMVDKRINARATGPSAPSARSDSTSQVRKSFR